MALNRFSPASCAALLRRLKRSQRGNALILAAALMVPLIALIGSGVDVGRVYLARSRMQQACDAASLAGRWAVGAGRDTSVVNSEANKFFNFNFPQGTYGTAAFTPSVSTSGGTTKVVTITASTTMPMSIMGLFGAPAMPVAASCDARQDYVNTDVVLVLDVTGSMKEKATPSDTQTKIEAMRAAVLSLFDQLAPIQTQLAAAGMRLRYSIVPYSSSVRVGKLLYAKSSSYIRLNNTYYHCDNNNNNCTNGRTYTTNKAWAENTWDGCIEERKTVVMSPTATNIPSNALDLDLDLVPTSNTSDSSWPPLGTYDVKNVDQTDRFCPAEAKTLQSWTKSDLTRYLNTLQPVGSTYHDIGMIWGGRMISSAGVFGDSVDTYNGMPVKKFVIFMTDGLLSTDGDTYSAYGVENWDKRITGGSGSQNDRHRARFNLICNAVKSKASIWVVAFASAMDDSLRNCATNAGQADESANSDDLIKKFAEIGKNIGALRLSQ